VGARRGVKRQGPFNSSASGIDPHDPVSAATSFHSFLHVSLEHLLRDARFAVRTISRTRAFALVAIASLALGIGANTAMFSLVNGLLFSKPTLPESNKLVELHRYFPGGSFNALSSHDIEDIRDGLPGLVTGISAYLPFTGQIGGTTGPGTVVLGELVNADYFRLLGVEMGAGRGFLPEEDKVALAAPVIVIGDRLWRRQLGADPRTVGSVVRLNGRQYTVVGIAPPGFSSHTGGIHVDVWAPIAMAAHLSPFEPEWDNLFAVARLADGTTSAALTQAMTALAARLDPVRGRSDRRWNYTATSFDDVIFTPSFDGTIKAIAALLLAVVALVLLVTCSNLAGFLLARATDRRREMAIRMATGASRGAAVSQLLMEALLLSLVGGVVGLILSQWLIRLVLASNLPLPIPLNLEIGVDGKVLLYTFGASLAAGIFFGLVPAMRATKVEIAPTLRQESGGSSSGGVSRLRNGLIAGQLALSLVLLITAALFVDSMRSALEVAPGFSTAPAGVVTVDLRGSGYAPDEYPEAYRKLREAVAGLSGVEQVAVANRLPMTIGNAGTTIGVPGVENGRGGNEFYLESSVVSPEFFDVMGIPMLQGAAFTDAQRLGSPGVAIMNRAAAERLWPGQNPVGRTVTIDGAPVTIVGVSETARDRGLTETPRRMLYTPMLQSYAPQLIFLARGRQPAARLADEMRRAVLAVNPDLFVVDAKTLDQHLGVMYFLPRMAAWLMSGFAVLALALGCIGLYGAVSHAVARRSRELAIRLALGATARDVVALVVRSGMTLVIAGGAVGLVLSLAASRVLGQFLIGGRGFDPAIFAGVAVLLAAVTLFASWLPARRAGRVNAMSAMRAE
jgi:predicted permease